MAAPSGYRTLPPAAGLGLAAAQTASRLSEMLDYVKHEVDALNSESVTLKTQNMEYESHTATHASEVSALRHTLTDLEREHDKIKRQYEDETKRLRQELETLCETRCCRYTTGADLNTASRKQAGSTAVNGSARAIRASSESVGHAQPPQVGHGPSNLFGSIMSHTNAMRPGSGPAHTLPGPHLVDGAANGWDRERERERERDGGGISGGAALDHPSKRLRLDETAARESTFAERSPPPSAPHLPSVAKGAAPPLTAKAGSPSEPRRPGPLNLTRPGGASVLSTPIDAAAVAVAPSDYRSTPPPRTPNSEMVREQRSDGPGADWVTLFRPRTKREVNLDLIHTLSHDSVVCCVRFSPDGRLLATGCNRNVLLYDTTTGDIRTTLTDHSNAKSDNYIRSVSFSPDGETLATGAEDHVIRIWHLRDQRIIRTLEGHRSEIYSLAYSPDGRYLASGSGDRSAHIWDTASGTLRFALPINDQTDHDGQVDAGVTSVAISSDGALVAAGSLDTVVRVWNLDDGTLLQRLRGHRDSVYSVAFSPDGKWLVSGSLDKTLKLWELDKLRVKAEATAAATVDDDHPHETVVPCFSTLSGHKDYVLSVAVSTDGRWIISGSKDRGVNFWDPKTSQPAVVLQGHKNSVISIAVSEVGGLLATGSGDWTSRIWRMNNVEQEQTV